MARRLSTQDFRAVRIILEPDDFALGADIPEPPPSDLIDQSTWHGIMDLPDDVSVRTSNHKGVRLRLLYILHSEWIGVVGDSNHPDPLFDTMLDAHDEFDAMLFLLIHGYYRQAIGCLRNALELVAIGAYAQLLGKASEFSDWKAGTIDMSFGSACDGLLSTPATQPLHRHLRKTVHDSLFDQKQAGKPGGWARRLFDTLSDYAHSRPGVTNGSLWQSNGPIYVPRAFVRTVSLALEVYALAYLLVKLGRPSFVAPPQASRLFESYSVGGALPIAAVTYTYLFAA